MGLAFLTIGLVRPWGETFPNWVPVIGGRDVPARGATIAALTGATIIWLLNVFYFIRQITGVDNVDTQPGCSPPDLEILIFYMPLIAWAPLLFVVALHYHHRRTAER
jgi:hypothetical protein